MSAAPGPFDPRPASAPMDFDSWAATAGPQLLRFAQLVCHNAADAADAVQDALVAVLLRWRRLSAEDAQDAYARRVVVNHRITLWRRIGRRESVVADVELPDPLRSAEQLADDADQARRLIAALPPRQRAAVVLRYYEDLPFEEIAAVLGCGESTARSHVHRALQRLRELLGGAEHGRT